MSEKHVFNGVKIREILQEIESLISEYEHNRNKLKEKLNFMITGKDEPVSSSTILAEKSIDYTCDLEESLETIKNKLQRANFYISTLFDVRKKGEKDE